MFGRPRYAVGDTAIDDALPESDAAELAAEKEAAYDREEELARREDIRLRAMWAQTALPDQGAYEQAAKDLLAAFPGSDMPGHGYVVRLLREYFPIKEIQGTPGTVSELRAFAGATAAYGAWFTENQDQLRTAYPFSVLRWISSEWHRWTWPE